MLNEEDKKFFKDLTSQAPLVLFMKGDKYIPQCGFSAHVVDILKSIGVDFATYDILEDDRTRQGLKEYSAWPTFPQLYLKGELVGGCDIINEMHESGELKELFDKELK